MKTLADFKSSADGRETLLEALPAPLWPCGTTRKGDWDGARRGQDIESTDGAWIHAYLHRKEGDASNAAYWYRRAGKPVARATLEEEWEEIASALLLKEGVGISGSVEARGRRNDSVGPSGSDCHSEDQESRRDDRAPTPVPRTNRWTIIAPTIVPPASTSPTWIVLGTRNSRPPAT